MQRGLPHRHDVVDQDTRLVEQPEFELSPGLRRRFLGIADHQIDLRQTGKGLRVDLRRAAGDDDPRVRVGTTGLADRLARLALGLRRHRAGVEHQRVGEPLGLANALIVSAS